MAMTSRERMETVLRHARPDRTPVFEYCLLSPLADIFLGHPFAATAENWDALEAGKGWEAALKQCASDHLDLAELLGHDLMYIQPNPPPAAKRVKRKEIAEELPEDPVERVALSCAKAEQGPLTLPDESFDIYRALREEMQRRGLEIPILAPAYFHGVWTNVDLMQTMLLDPPVAHRHFAIATAQAKSRITVYHHAGVDQAGVGGDFSGTRPLISPEAYREFIVPEVREVSRHAHSLGMRTVNASDGNLWPVIDDFLFGCEVDAYLEIDFHAGMDLRKLLQAYGGQKTFYGNLDCGNILSFGSRETINKHVRECIEAGLTHGGHVLCASNAITASVPLENYLVVVETYREIFGLPQLKLR